MIQFSIESRWSKWALAAAFALMVAGPASAQGSPMSGPAPEAPPGGVLGGQYCRDLASMLALLDQRANAYALAADTLSARSGEDATRSAQRASVEADKARTEAAALRRTYTLQCDRPALQTVTPPASRAEQGPRPSIGGGLLDIDLPLDVTGTDGWMLWVDGQLARPWRDDPAGQQVPGALWLYLSDSGALLLAEPVIREQPDGDVERLTCQRVGVTESGGFRFEATMPDAPGQRYIAEGRVEVTGTMTTGRDAPEWPVTVRFAFSYLQQGTSGVRFADGGVFEGTGVAQRMTDIAGLAARRSRSGAHTCPN